MADDATLDQALGPRDTTRIPTPKKGEVSLDSVLGPDKTPYLARQGKDALRSIQEQLTPKGAMKNWDDSWTHALVGLAGEAAEAATSMLAASDYGDTSGLKLIAQKDKERALEAKIQRGGKEEPPLSESIKEAGKDIKEGVKAIGENPGKVIPAMLAAMVPDIPLMVGTAGLGVPAKVGKVLQTLGAAERAVKVGKAAGAVAEGAALGATGEAAKQYEAEGRVTPGPAAKGAINMAALDVGARALGLLKPGMKKPKEIPTEEVNKNEGTSWKDIAIPTTSENIALRKVFTNDHDYSGYLGVQSSQLAERPVNEAFQSAAKDAHAAATAVGKEVNGKMPVDAMPFPEIKNILDKDPKVRTKEERARLKKWQITGLMSVAGGAGIAYSLADLDTQKEMAGAGIAMSAPFILKDFHGQSALPKLESFIKQMNEKYHPAWTDEHITPAEMKEYEGLVNSAMKENADQTKKLSESGLKKEDLPESGKPPKGEYHPELTPAGWSLEKEGNTWYAKKGDQEINDPDKGKLVEYVKTLYPEGFKSRFELAKPATNHFQIQTPEFKGWFRDSKIKDEKGVPLLYYHGTAREIHEFQPKQAGAIFASPSPNFSAAFADMSRNWIRGNYDKIYTPQQIKALEHSAVRSIAKRLKITETQAAKQFEGRLDKTPEFIEMAEKHLKSGQNVMPVFIRAEKPWDFEKPEDVKAVVEKVMPGEPQLIKEDLEQSLSRGDWEIIESKKVQEAIKALGYDAFHMKETGQKNLAVYDSRQIKSATGNSGAFAEVANISGKASQEFMLLLAGATGGFLLGSQMDKDHSIRDELIGIALGTLAGRIAGKAIEDVKPGALGRAARSAADSMKPGGAKEAATRMASKVPGGEKPSAKPERIRINEAINNHQTRIARAAREIMQVQTKLMEAVPDAARREVITRALDGENVMLTKTEKQMYEELKTAFKNIGDEAVRIGVLDELRENYVTHLIKRGQEDKLKAFLNKIKGAASMSPTSPYANPRKFPTIKELEAAGIELVSKDAAHIYATYGYAMTRTIANKELIQALINDSRGIFMPAGAKAPEGFKTVDRPLILGMKVHPDIVPELSYLFDTREPDAWVKAASALSTGIKRAEVSFSLFHAVALTQAFVASQSKLSHGLAGAAVGAGVAASTGSDSYTGALAGFAGTMLAPAAYKAVQFSRGKDALLKQLREGGVGDEVDKALRDGLRISMEKNRPVVGEVAQDFYSGLEGLQGLADKFVHPIAGQAIGKVNALNHAIDNWMWGRLHAGMKLNVYMDKKSKLLKNNAKARDRTPETPLLSEERAGEIAASYANSLFGGLNWTRLMEGVESKFGRQIASALTSPTGMRYANFLTFAPDWTVSTTSSALRAADFRPSQQELAGLHRQYVVRAALWTLAATEAITYSQTGQHIWEYPAEEWTVAHLGDGSTMQVSKHATEPAQWVLKGRQEVLNKVGAVPAEMYEQISGDKYLSTKGAPKMKGAGEHLAHLGKRLLPFSGQQFSEGNAVGAISGTLGVPVYPPKKKGGKKKKSQDYLDEAVE